MTCVHDALPRACLNGAHLLVSAHAKKRAGRRQLIRRSVLFTGKNQRVAPGNLVKASALVKSFPRRGGLATKPRVTSTRFLRRPAPRYLYLHPAHDHSDPAPAGRTHGQQRNVDSGRTAFAGQLSLNPSFSHLAIAY